MPAFFVLVGRRGAGSAAAASVRSAGQSARHAALLARLPGPLAPWRYSPTAAAKPLLEALQRVWAGGGAPAETGECACGGASASQEVAGTGEGEEATDSASLCDACDERWAAAVLSGPGVSVCPLPSPAPQPIVDAVAAAGLRLCLALESQGREWGGAGGSGGGRLVADVRAEHIALQRWAAAAVLPWCHPFTAAAPPPAHSDSGVRRTAAGLLHAWEAFESRCALRAGDADAPRLLLAQLRAHGGGIFARETLQGYRQSLAAHAVRCLRAVREAAVEKGGRAALRRLPFADAAAIAGLCAPRRPPLGSGLPLPLQIWGLPSDALLPLPIPPPIPRVPEPGLLWALPLPLAGPGAVPASGLGYGCCWEGGMAEAETGSPGSDELALAMGYLLNMR